jgi:hypothetical protein
MNPSNRQPSLPISSGDEELAGGGDDGRLLMSPSSVIGYMSDPAKYYFKKVLKRREPGSKHMLEGTVYHGLIEFFLGHKKHKGELPTMDQIRTYTETLWREELKKLDPARHPDAGRLGYVLNFIPLLLDKMGHLDAKFIEHYVRRPVRGAEWDIHGYIDLIHTTAPGVDELFDPRTDTVTDFKSKGSSPPKNAKGEYTLTNNDMLQLTMYAYAVSAGNHSVKAEITYLIKTVTPKIITIPITITVDEQQRRLTTIGNIVKAIQNNIFTPNYGSWSCFPGKCLFYKECREIF